MSTCVANLQTGNLPAKKEKKEKSEKKPFSCQAKLTFVNVTRVGIFMSKQMVSICICLYVCMYISKAYMYVVSFMQSCKCELCGIEYLKTHLDVKMALQENVRNQFWTTTNTKLACQTAYHKGIEFGKVFCFYSFALKI